MGKAILPVNVGMSSVSVTVYSFDRSPTKIASAKVWFDSVTVSVQVHSRLKQTSKEVKDNLESPQDTFKHPIEHALNDKDPVTKSIMRTSAIDTAEI